MRGRCFGHDSQRWSSRLRIRACGNQKAKRQKTECERDCAVDFHSLFSLAQAESPAQMSLSLNGRPEFLTGATVFAGCETVGIWNFIAGSPNRFHVRRTSLSVVPCLAN